MRWKTCDRERSKKEREKRINKALLPRASSWSCFFLLLQPICSYLLVLQCLRSIASLQRLQCHWLEHSFQAILQPRDLCYRILQREITVRDTEEAEGRENVSVTTASVAFYSASFLF